MINWYLKPLGKPWTAEMPLEKEYARISKWFRDDAIRRGRKTEEA